MKTPSAIRPRVKVRNINVPGYEVEVDGIKYEAMRQALLAILPEQGPGLTQTQMRQQVLDHLPQDEFPAGAKADWWSKCVQLDLEAQGVIERDDTAKPLRWKRRP